MDDRFNFNDFLLLALIGCLLYTTTFYWLLYKQLSKGNIKIMQRIEPFTFTFAVYSNVITTACTNCKFRRKMTAV